jgi:uncharacterized membrane protein
MFARGKHKQSPRTKPPEIKRPRTSTRLRLGFASRLRNYFIAGILITAPVSITFWIAWNLISFIDGKVTPLIPPQWNPETYLPFGLPGLGLVFVFVVLAVIGFLTANLVGHMLMRRGEAILARVPVVRSIYSATKQVFETVLAQKSTAFRQVALIEYPCRGTWAIGFITGQTVGEVQEQTDDTVINVFVPATPNPTTGFLLFVPERDVHVLDMTVEDGIKLVISGGLVSPANGLEPPKTQTITAEMQEAERRARDDEEAPSAPKKSGLAGRLRNYFFAGVLITAPVSITLWLAWKFVSYVDDQVTPLIPPKWNPETYVPFDLPGLGLVVAFVGLTLIGMVTAGLTGRILTRIGERIVTRLPVVRSIYSAVKQIFETILAKKSPAFRQTVLLQYPRPGVWAIGFQTGSAEGHVQEIVDDQVINVFLPTTPNPTSGFLLFLPISEVTVLSMTVEEGLKMVVSGGIVTPPDRRAPDERVPDERVPDERGKTTTTDDAAGAKPPRTMAQPAIESG